MRMKQFFKDKTGKYSMMRLAFYTIIVNSCSIAWIYPDNDVLILGMLATSATLKWAQKREEK